MALALTSRRRALAAAASAVAAMALAAAVVGRGCGVSTPGPEATVRSLVQAARAGDRQAVWTLLSPDTQARLERQAKHATELVGVEHPLHRARLISIGSSDDVPPPTDIRVVSSKGDRRGGRGGGAGGQGDLDAGAGRRPLAHRLARSERSCASGDQTAVVGVEAGVDVMAADVVQVEGGRPRGALERALDDVFGFAGLRPGQAEVIADIFDGPPGGRGDADRRRQVAVLPAARGRARRARRRHAGGVAADRADEGSGRRADARGASRRSR